MLGCGPLHLAFPGDVAYACTNIQEEEDGTPHIDTWRNTKVWVDFFGDLHKWQNSWYKGEKCDNKEWYSNYKHPFLGVSRY